MAPSWIFRQETLLAALPPRSSLQTMISFYAGALSLWVVAVLQVIARHIKWKRDMQRRNPQAMPYPPGPKPLPLIGNVFDMPRSQSSLTFIKWRDMYGPLTWVVTPGRQFLIVNDYEMIKELFERRGNIYINRPRLIMAGELIGLDKGTPLTQYGPVWRQHRRMLSHALLAPIVRRDYGPMMTKKTITFLKTLLDRPDDFILESKKLMAEIITEIAYGAHRDDEDGGHDYIQMQIEMGIITFKTVQGYWVDFFPWMKHIPPWFPFAQWKRDALGWSKVYNITRDYLFESVKQKFLTTNGEGMQPSFVLTMLKELYSQVDDKGDEDLTNNERAINHAAFSFFRAGAETTESVVRNFFLAMTLFPEAQARAQAEVDTFIGQDRFPSIEDRGIDKMPYLEATVLESLRWNPPASTGVPHLPVVDDFFQGYFIPKGTTVFQNSWQISRDARYYANPTAFQPERFLKTDQKKPRCVHNPDVLSPWDWAFGFGRRICPGRDLAMQGAWLSVAFVLWAFEIKPKLGRTMAGGYKATDEERFNFRVSSKTLPFECDFTPRSDKVRQMINQAVEEGKKAGGP
ncbi:hypothetical protein M407DRAFT_31945 [Tulasnella calospora MUT 4182]|uniref:Cytochrome P450 n=1 Tax=Tulasnella calospora MUT 4182 TaxID=1051891 RepID=A0A0C3PU84_9AGAM|nr:hypothetical protein M407DRAFT_31945 [Tulasnella calospora MUT 4182]